MCDGYAPTGAVITPEVALSRDERIVLTWTVLQVLDAWCLPQQVQLDLLGLGGFLNVGQLGRFRFGTPLPAQGDVYQRVHLLLRLDQALHQIFPHSALAAGLWITTPCPRLAQATPLDSLLRGDLGTLRRLVGCLDNMPLY